MHDKHFFYLHMRIIVHLEIYLSHCLLFFSDMIAIPDYISGATEHWGLITYRETSFLVDEATASVKNKISIANTIAHELAHMWFGNLGKTTD